MEFKYRAVDDRTTTKTSYPTPHNYTLHDTTYFPEPPFRGGFSSTGTNPIPNTSRVSVNDAIFAREALRREIEKSQIRREIIAREVARRLELEEEVRRELALERGGEVWGIAAPHHVFSFDETLAMRLNRPRITPFESVYDVPLSKPPPLPQLAMAPVDVEREEISKDRVIILDKPNPDVYAAKRKAVTTPVVDGCEIPPFGLKKKTKEEWSCALCQVSATSEKGLNNHLQGRKHRAKEAALRLQKVGTSSRTSVSSTKIKSSVKSIEAITAATSGLDAKPDRDSLQPGVNWGDIDHPMGDKGVAYSKNEEQLVQNSQNTGLKNGAATNAALKRRFWCRICKVRTFSQDVMESHKKGKKHMKLMKKLNPNYGSSQLTSSVSQEEITCVLNNEKVINIAEFC